MVPSVLTEKIPSVIPPGIDPEIVRLIAQYLNHYATPGPGTSIFIFIIHALKLIYQAQKSFSKAKENRCQTLYL
jgi:hypothetical protein